MKKDSFEKKLAGYIALASAMLATAKESNAQIIYTDVNPDLAIDNSYFNLDLNNDGVYDVILENEHNASSFVTCPYGCDGHSYSLERANILLQGQNEVVIDGNNCNGLPKPLNAGVMFGGNNSWGNGFGTSVFQYSYAALQSHIHSGGATCSSWGNSFDGGAGCFPGSNFEKFIGLKINSNGNNYYGWARVQIGTHNVITLKDYAVNTIPDASIVTGDTGNGCAINNLTTSPIGLYWLCNDSVDVHLFNSDSLNVQWMKNGNWLSGEIDSVYTIHQQGDYQALVSDSNCAVIINAVYVRKIDFNIGVCSIDDICSGSTAFIDISISGNSPSYSYSWSNGSNTQDLLNISSGVYTLTVTSTLCSIEDSITINIGDTPPLPILSETLTDSVCTNSGSIDLTVTGGAPPFSYSWNNFSNTQDQNNLSSGFYTVTVTDNNGCSLSDTVIINPFGAVLTVTHPDSVCDNSGYINLIPTGGTLPYSYEWSTGSTNQNIQNLNWGNYSVTVTDAVGCISYLNNIHLNHLSFISPQIIQNNNTLQVTSIYSAYQWYLSNTQVNGATNQQYLTTQTGPYKVLTTNTNGCTGFSNTIAIHINAINEIASPEINILIDPKYLQVIFPNEKFIGSQLQLFNSTGQLVREMIATKNTENIPIEQLPKGIYILSIRNGNESRNYKVAIL